MSSLRPLNGQHHAFMPVSSLVSRANPKILTVAHRGAWHVAPENSLASIREAAALGAEIVEIDAQTTADGRVVVIHDATLDRTTDHQGSVAERDFADIQQARLRLSCGGPDTPVSNERLPTLAEALEEARGRIIVNIDTKYARDLEAVAAVVTDLGMAEQIIMKTELNLDGDPFRATDFSFFGHIPHMPIMRARPGRFATDLAMIARLASPMIEVKFSDLADLAAAREELERQNIRLWINTIDVSHCLDYCDTRATVDPHGVWGTLIEAGVGAIQTDLVEALPAWLAEHGAAT
jgi:glycerophosphoryl diester phosphodiesterase